MDLPGVLARAPELCLIDELAHSNAPGVEHEKRYEDVRDVLAAGIDVFSTVNVQHLESLNDQVAQLTGTQVRETIPDEVLSAADEVVLIDLTPEALIGRLRAGKVYRPERVQAALSNFFKIENLAALRETALRQVAEDVEVKRLVRRAPSEQSPPATRRDDDERPAAAEAPPQAIAERLLALATLDAASERVVRRAWRSAQRLDAELDVLVVRLPGRPPSRRRPRAAGGAAAPGGDARRAPARRGGRRRGRGSRRGGARARLDVRVDGHAGRSPRHRAPGAARRVAGRRRCSVACCASCRAWTCASSRTPSCAAPGSPPKRRRRGPTRTKRPVKTSRREAGRGLKAA